MITLAVCVERIILSGKKKKEEIKLLMITTTTHDTMAGFIGNALALYCTYL